MVIVTAEWLAFEIGSFVSGSVNGVQLAAFTITLNLTAILFIVSTIGCVSTSTYLYGIHLKVSI